MPEETIRLFGSRAERLLQSDDSETFRDAIEKAIEQVPVVGPITTFFMSKYWLPSGRKRLEEWLQDLANDFEHHCASCDVKKLVVDEVFISASIQIARIVVATHQEEKRTYLRNALLNIVNKREASEELQQIFINAIEAFSVLHVSVLNTLWTGVRDLNERGLWQASSPRGITNYGKAIGALHPNLQGEEELLRYVITDLRNRGMTPMSGPEAPFPIGGSQAITNMGIRFLQFVLEPKRSTP